MGDAEITQEIFEIEDKFGKKFEICETTGDSYKVKFIMIDERASFTLSKPLAKKIIKALKEEYKIDG